MLIFFCLFYSSFLCIYLFLVVLGLWLQHAVFPELLCSGFSLRRPLLFGSTELRPQEPWGKHVESSRARIEPSVPPLCKADSSPLDYHRSPDLNAFGKPVFLLAVVLFTFQPFGGILFKLFFCSFPMCGCTGDYYPCNFSFEESEFSFVASNLFL